MRPSTRLLALLPMLALACAAPAARSTSQPQPRQAEVLGALAGRWTGVLEYADYRSGRRVQLPTRVAATADGAAGTLDLGFVYREPSGDTVTSRSAHRMDLAAGRYGMDEDTFAIASLEGFTSAAGGRMVLTGMVMENDRPEPARHTFTLAGDTLRILKETRDPWQFRNEYRLVRAAPPAP